MQNSGWINVFCLIVISAQFTSCKGFTDVMDTLSVASDIDSDINDRSMFTGKIKKVSAVSNDKMSIQFTDGAIYEVFQQPPFLFDENKYYEVYYRSGHKDHPKIRVYEPPTTDVSEGIVERVEYKQNEMMTVHLDTGVSYEVKENPSIKRGQKVKIKKQDIDKTYIVVIVSEGK